MGRKIRLQERKRQAAEHSLAARLKAHSQKPSTGAVTGYSEFAAEYRAAIEAYRVRAVRPPEEWRCRIKSRSPDRRFLDLVRFTFSHYAAPAHLENLWIGDPHYVFWDRVTARARGEYYRSDLRGWHILVAQGGSLHKQATFRYLSRAETHHLLAAPACITSIGAAFWYAIACAQGAERALALRIAQTKLADFSVACGYWRDVARFFTRHPTSVREMDDLIDFFLAARDADEKFTLKGRSLETMRRRMGDWHRALRKQELVCGGAWEGHPLPDIDYEAGGEHRKAIWRFRQIKTGNDLFKEGQRMHHCVASYKARCITGAVSIWSLTCEYPPGKHNRGVTLEVRNDGSIAQCRGFANRAPYANEEAMVRRWAADHGLVWRA